MKKIVALLFTVLSLVSAKEGVAQFATQAFQMGTFSAPYDVATDLQNNVLVTGSFELAGTTNASVLVKYGPDGSILWGAEVVGPGVITGKKVCADATGNVFVAGHYYNINSDSAQLVGGPVWYDQIEGTFLAKYNSMGNLLWVRTISAAVNEVIGEIACTPNGEVIVVGWHVGNVTFGNTILPDQGGFIVKYSDTGSVLWAKHAYGGTTITGVSIGPADNVLVTGVFSDSLTIGGTTIMGSSSYDVYVASFSPTGTMHWVETSVFPSGIVQTSRIGSDSTGNIYISGIMNGYDIAFGSIILPGGTPENTFVVKYSANGNVVWAKQLGNTNNHIGLADMAVSKQGAIYLGGSFLDSVVLGPDTIVTDPGNLNLYFSKIDSSGNISWAISGGVPGIDEGIFGLALNQTDNCYMAGGAYSTDPFIMGGLATVNDNGFLYEFNIVGLPNHISGKVFYDLDANSVMDFNEQAATGIILQAGSHLYNTDSNGIYNIYTPPGAYVLNVPNAPPYYSVAPVSHLVTFPGYGDSDTSRYFAIQPVPGMQDLQVTLTSTTVPRPGFSYPLNVTYRNIGTTTLTGSLELQLDSLLLFQSSAPMQTSISGNTLSWNFTNLQPTESATIVVNTTVPATAILGTVIHQTASISPLIGDLTPVDNTDTESAIVVGSYDPNDKQVNYSSLTPNQVQNEEWLEYTIRFQNTGTDTAFTVRLADTLSAMLNIPTIEILSSSHPNTWSIKGTGILEFRFDNILLPDSNTNEAASHGFVKYRIKPKASLVLGDVIENTAYIYFDFNAPIVTNTVSTEVQLITSVPTSETNPLRVYPNPNNGTFTLHCSNIWASQVQAELRNVLGQIVWQQNLVVENGKLQQVVRTNNLSKGVYYLQLKTEKGIKVQKVVIE